MCVCGGGGETFAYSLEAPLNRVDYNQGQIQDIWKGVSYV